MMIFMTIRGYKCVVNVYIYSFLNSQEDTQKDQLVNNQIQTFYFLHFYNLSLWTMVRN